MSNLEFWLAVEPVYEIATREYGIRGDRPAEIARIAGQLIEWASGTLVGDVYAVDIAPALRAGVAALAGASVDSVLEAATVAANAGGRIADRFVRVARESPGRDPSIVLFADACADFVALRRFARDIGPCPVATWWGAPATRMVARAVGGSIADPPAGWEPDAPPSGDMLAAVCGHATFVAAHALSTATPPLRSATPFAALSGLTPARNGRATELLRLMALSRAVAARVGGSYDGDEDAELRDGTVRSALTVLGNVSQMLARSGERASMGDLIEIALATHRGDVATEFAQFICRMMVFRSSRHNSIKELRQVLAAGIHRPILVADRSLADRVADAIRLATAFDSPVEALPGVVLPGMPRRRPLPRAIDECLYRDDELTIVLMIARLAIDWGPESLAPTRFALSDALATVPQLADSISLAMHALTVVDLVCECDRFRHRSVATLMGVIDGATFFSAARISPNPRPRPGTDIADTHAADADLNCLVCTTDTGIFMRVAVPGDVARELRRACGFDPVADGAAAARALTAAYDARVDSGLARLRRWRFWPAVECVVGRLPPGDFPLRDVVLAGAGAPSARMDPECTLVASALATLATISAARPGWPEEVSTRRRIAVERVDRSIVPADTRDCATAMARARLAHALIAANCAMWGAIANPAGDEYCQKINAALKRALDEFALVQ